MLLLPVIQLICVGYEGWGVEGDRCAGEPLIPPPQSSKVRRTWESIATPCRPVDIRCPVERQFQQREISIDNLLVRVHLIIGMSRPALRHGNLNSLLQVASYLASTCESQTPHPKPPYTRCPTPLPTLTPEPYLSTAHLFDVRCPGMRFEGWREGGRDRGREREKERERERGREREIARERARKSVCVEGGGGGSERERVRLIPGSGVGADRLGLL